MVRCVWEILTRAPTRTTQYVELRAVAMDQHPPTGMTVEESLDEIRVMFQGTTFITKRPIVTQFLLAALLALLPAFFLSVFIWELFIALVCLFTAVGWMYLSMELPEWTEENHHQHAMTVSRHQAEFWEDGQVTRLPLEAVVRVEARSGILQVKTASQEYSLYAGIQGDCARWLSVLLGTYAQRRRAALKATGDNPDQRARPPESLDALKSRL